jgi:hypothetical protein
MLQTPSTTCGAPPSKVNEIWTKKISRTKCVFSTRSLRVQSFPKLKSQVHLRTFNLYKETNEVHIIHNLNKWLISRAVKGPIEQRKLIIEPWDSIVVRISSSNIGFRNLYISSCMPSSLNYVSPLVPMFFLSNVFLKLS